MLIKLLDSISSMRARSNYLTPEQLEDIIANIPRLNSRKWDNIDIEYLFRIAYECALRPSEACNIKKEHIDLELREIFLGRTKTKENDTAVIPGPFVLPLRAYLQAKPNGQLLPGCNRFIVHQWLNKFGHWLDIPAFLTPQSESHEKTKGHIFRKSKAKDLLYGTADGRKAPLNIIMNKLRHNSLESTIKYLKLQNADVKEWES